MKRVCCAVAVQMVVGRKSGFLFTPLLASSSPGLSLFLPLSIYLFFFCLV